MKIQILSDLHFNQHGFLDRTPPEIHPEADVLVLAGDIVDGRFLTKAPMTFKKWYSDIPIPIIYVLGNHEYDHLQVVDGAVYKYQEWLRSLNPNTYLLENSSVKIGEVTFFGTTLFTKLSPLDEARLRSFFYHLPIPLNFNGSWWTEKFRIAKQYLVKSLSRLSPSERATTVVVSHFAPTYKSIHEDYKGNYSNSFFANDLDGLLKRYPAKYWIHGHLHSCSRNLVGNTEVIVNPHGYIFPDGRRELRTEQFNPTLLVNI